jgi:soluble P-type ATPase
MSWHIDIPDYGELVIEYILFDLNGTLACEGRIVPSTRQRLAALGGQVDLVVMSADTHGTLAAECAGLPLQIRRVGAGAGAPQKLALLEALGPARTAAVGNGRNDVQMLRAAALGIAILGPEGAAREALLAADIWFATIDDALDSLLNPRRLVATLRG